jgi:cyclic pyranopterin phosphate synthase
MAVSVTTSPTETPAARLTDSHGRVIHDLRVSITDRCNYKCVYCRTGEIGAQYADLSIAEYLRMVRLFVELGIAKVRLTGGEPLLRHGLLELVRELARLRTAAGGPLDLALTTNGHLLDSLAQPLKDAGLNRITVSMDAVDEAIFERITRVPGSYSAVMRGICAAARIQRRPGGELCPLCAQRRRDCAIHRVHASRRGPPVVAGDCRAPARDRGAREARAASGRIAPQ